MESTQYNSNTMRSSTATSKHIELYQRAKPLHERRDKTKSDFEYESGLRDLTFKPDIAVSQMIRNGEQEHIDT